MSIWFWLLLLLHRHRLGVHLSLSQKPHHKDGKKRDHNPKHRTTHNAPGDQPRARICRGSLSHLHCYRGDGL
jgi:hypothetical protein